MYGAVVRSACRPTAPSTPPAGTTTSMPLCEHKSFDDDKRAYQNRSVQSIPTAEEPCMKTTSRRMEEKLVMTQQQLIVEIRILNKSSTFDGCGLGVSAIRVDGGQWSFIVEYMENDSPFNARHGSLGAGDLVLNFTVSDAYSTRCFDFTEGRNVEGERALFDAIHGIYGAFRDGNASDHVTFSALVERTILLKQSLYSNLCRS